MRFRLIVELDYPNAKEDDEQKLREHLSSVVHTAASSGMFDDGMEYGVETVAAACQCLEDPPPPTGRESDAREVQRSVGRQPEDEPLTCATCGAKREVGEPCDCSEPEDDGEDSPL